MTPESPHFSKLDIIKDRLAKLTPAEKRYIWQLILLATTQVGDVITTALVIHYGGEEGNPINKWIMMHGGMQEFMQFKILASIGLIALFELGRLKNERKELAEWYLKFVSRPNRCMNALMVSILVFNTANLLSNLPH